MAHGRQVVVEDLDLGKLSRQEVPQVQGGASHLEVEERGYNDLSQIKGGKKRWHSIHEEAANVWSLK